MSTQQNNKELAELYARCCRLDWTYMMSDDNSVYNRGLAAEGALRRDCERHGPKAHKMYADFYAHVWDFNSPKTTIHPQLKDYLDAEGKDTTAETDAGGIDDPRPATAAQDEEGRGGE